MRGVALALAAAIAASATACADRVISESGFEDDEPPVDDEYPPPVEPPVDPDPSGEPGDRGMTWILITHEEDFGIDLMGCSGRCDPYVGDTSCAESRPVLCLYPANEPKPDIEVNFYEGWTGAYIELSEPVRGDRFLSIVDVDQYCADSFGQGWRAAEFHDGDGGWGWWAYGDIGTERPVWVHINDQPQGNCWTL